MKAIVVDEKIVAVESLVDVLKNVDASFAIDCAYDAKSALELIEQSHYDIAFLDIEMPEMNGIDLAHRIKQLSPDTNIIFVTSHPSYSLEAHGLYPSGFLVKPVSEDDVAEALSNLRQPIVQESQKRMNVKCFGNFEAFVDGSPLAFSRPKTKELLAYLVDREGAMCSLAEISLALWEDDTATKIAQVRNLISDLRNSLRKADLEEVLVRSQGFVAVNCSLFDCDYYDFLRANPAAIRRYHGEYMNQYSWADFTCGRLATQFGW